MAYPESSKPYHETEYLAVIANRLDGISSLLDSLVKLLTTAPTVVTLEATETEPQPRPPAITNRVDTAIKPKTRTRKRK